MRENAQRKILFYNNFFEDFYSKQTKEVQKKIDETVGLVQDTKVTPEKVLKQIENTGGLYEILVKSGTNTIQIFCFLDEGDLILLQMGVRSRLKMERDDDTRKAIKLRKEYFEKKKGK